MKNFIRSFLVLSLTLALTPQTFAQGRKSTYSPGTSAYGSSISYGYSNEIITNVTSGSILNAKNCKTCSTATNINLSGAYLRTINANVQAGGLITIATGPNSYLGTSSDTQFTLVALGVYNFETDFKNAFFAIGGLGLYPVVRDNLVGYENKFGFFIGAGKRFPIWDRINFIPTVSLEKKGDQDIGFNIQFLNFSLMF